MSDHDRGPTKAIAKLFTQAPDFTPHKNHFWFDWGPIFYRGRLNGSARVLCVASDPGPTERVAGRTLVGDAGQRVQGFLAKLGLTRSYICLNALVYALFPTHGASGRKIIKEPDQTAWRNKVFDKLTPNIQAVIAFGQNAQLAVSLWPGKANQPVFDLPHPSSHSAKPLLDAWRAAVPQLRAVVTPDPDGDPTLPNYRSSFEESDYARIPARDLPYGIPAWFGDDAWGRTATPKHSNSVERPPGDFHTLIWIAPPS